MNKQGSPTAQFKSRFCFGLLALSCIALPVGTAYAQEPDATGTVTCKQVREVPDETGGPSDFVVETVTYPVGYFFVSNMVVGRWGEGQDREYEGSFGSIAVKGPPEADPPTRFELTAYFYLFTDAQDNPYSETGQWQIVVGKDNKTSIKGQSFAVKDDGDPRLAGDCAWNLKGTAPEWFLDNFPANAP